MPRSVTLVPLAAVAVAALAATVAPIVPAVADGPTGPFAGADAGDIARTARVITEKVHPLATVGGVSLDGAAFGSAWTAEPGTKNRYFGLTDRGPNVDGPNGSKVEPLPSFTPMIGEFKVNGNRAKLLRTIPLAGADGTPYNGRVSTEASTGETITDIDGNVLAPSPYGYDPEGLVALPDGTFWISDEYGPYITHFSASGRQIGRLSPFDGSLPRELAEREPNKGMEGLTITPNGKTLVGIMQAGLDAPDGPKSKNLTPVRIVTVDLRTSATHEYLYLLHNTTGAGDAGTAVSEIAALDNNHFLVDERDGAMEPGANKKLYEIDLRGATDVGPQSTVANTTYDAAKGGLLVGGKAIEAFVGKANTADSDAALRGAGIAPVSSSLFLDIAGMLTAIDPAGGYYGHDKVEGVAVLDGGRQVMLSNDSDFGIDALANDAPPFTLHSKTLPDGRQDTGEELLVTMANVPAQFR